MTKGVTGSGDSGVPNVYQVSKNPDNPRWMVRFQRGGKSITPGRDFHDLQEAKDAAETLRRKLGARSSGRNGGRKPKPNPDPQIAMVCYAMPEGFDHVISFWPSVEEARKASAVVPCGRSCVGQHTLVWHDGERYRIESYGDAKEAARQWRLRQDEKMQAKKAAQRASYLRRRDAKTHCQNGHEYTDDNSYYTPKAGHRRCRICNRGNYTPKREPTGARAAVSNAVETNGVAKGGGIPHGEPTRQQATQAEVPPPKPQPATEPVQLHEIYAKTAERRNRRRHRKGKR
jgi:hypothetical protein